jgi:integrase
MYGGLIDSNQTEHSEETMITKPFSETEVRKIEKELSRRTDKVRDLALFRMGVDTMLRTSDLRNLRVADVCEANGGIAQRIEVKMKKTGGRVICVLDERTQAALQQWITSANKSHEDWLFTGRKGNEPITDVQHRRLVKEWCEMAGIDRARRSTHSVRKTKASVIFKKTQNIEAVRRLLGHASVANTSRYLGVENEDALELAMGIRI